MISYSFPECWKSQAVGIFVSPDQRADDAAAHICGAVGKSGSPISRCMMFFPYFQVPVPFKDFHHMKRRKLVALFEIIFLF